MIGTDPKSGEKVKRNSVVNIVVSKGVEKIALISYVGKGGDEALSELTNSGFDVKVDYKFSDKVFKGQVISQTPNFRRNRTWLKSRTSFVKRARVRICAKCTG